MEILDRKTDDHFKARSLALSIVKHYLNHSARLWVVGGTVVWCGVVLFVEVVKLTASLKAR
jgi:hypothetical protein